MLKNQLFSILTFAFILNCFFLENALAYLDPGSGSYIFQVLIGLFVGGLYSVKVYWGKISIYIQKIKDLISDRSTGKK